MLFSIPFLHPWCHLLNATPEKLSPTYPAVGTRVPECILVCCPVQSALNTSSFASAAMPWAQFVILCTFTRYPALCCESNLPFSFFKALESEEQIAGSTFTLVCLCFLMNGENILFISRDVSFTFHVLFLFLLAKKL